MSERVPRVLLIDDDAATGRFIRAVLEPEGIEVSTAETGREGVDSLRAFRPDAVLLDLRLPDVGGIELLDRLKEERNTVPVVILTGRVDVKTAVRAMQAGAVHYLTKPVDREELILVLRRAFERQALAHEVEALRRQSGPAAALAEQMGPSAAVARVVEQVAQVAGSDLTVLILGESGTGKELVAQAIHRLSPRRDAPLVPIDCGAIPEALLESELFGHEKGAFTGAQQRRRGQFQLADGGTIFLDEMANLPAALQPKLLRVLESRELRPVGSATAERFDARIVAATNVSLHDRVLAGRFREDLYFRLAQFTIRLPPLRERREDIPCLARRFASEFCLELKRPGAQIDPEALELLRQQRWPGNVRELRNVVRQAVLACPRPTVDRTCIESALQAAPAPADEPAPALEGASLKDIAERAAAAAERMAICAALRQSRGNKTAAARALRTDAKTLYVKLQRYAIAPPDYAADP